VRRELSEAIGRRKPFDPLLFCLLGSFPREHSAAALEGTGERHGCVPVVNLVFQGILVRPPRPCLIVSFVLARHSNGDRHGYKPLQGRAAYTLLREDDASAGYRPVSSLCRSESHSHLRSGVRYASGPECGAGGGEMNRRLTPVPVHLHSPSGAVRRRRWGDESRLADPSRRASKGAVS
jgi:hypothetical protein